MQVSTTKQAKRNTQILSKIGIFTLSFLLTASAVYVFSPIIKSHADTTATADININVDEVASLTVDTAALNLGTNLNSSVSGIINASVYTNSEFGYTLTLEDVDNSTNMTHTDTNVDSVITSNFEGNKTLSEMSDNTWGFSLNDTDFNKIPANGSPAVLKNTNTVPASIEIAPVTFGAKIGNIVAGTYTDSVLFTLYTNGQYSNCDNFFCATAMQQMTPQICATATTPLASATSYDTDGSHTGDNTYVPRIHIADTRNGNEYYVSKLADGNCWMTENLQIGGTTAVTLRPTDSDVEEEFEIPASNINDFVGDRYSTKGFYIDAEHGYFYNWFTATAGEGTQSKVGGDTEHSVCPKGWKLPSGGATGNYNTLYEAYGSDSAAIRNIPNFYNNGRVYSQRLDYYSDGYFWSSSVFDEWRAYNMELWGDSSESPSTTRSNKDFGMNIRCVAR